MCLMLLFPPASHAGATPKIRVLVRQSEEHSLIRGKDLTVEVEAGGRFRKAIGRIRGASLTFGGEGIRLDGSDVRGQRFSVSSRTGRLNYNGRERRGRIILTAGTDGMLVVNELPLDLYLTGLVNGEIDSKWPMEAVMAQVIAARTYALYRMKAGGLNYDVTDDVTDQVYLGPGAEDKRAAKAVRSTRGKALYYGGDLVPAFYHSSCGGRTADAGEIWGAPHPALVSVECGDCENAPRSRWELILGREELQEALDALFPRSGAIRSLGIHKRTTSGRVKTLSFVTREGRTLVDGVDFRKEIGTTRLLSTWFNISAVDGKIHFRGRGYGHGIGLCQWGAKGAAERGLDHREILRRYYKGANIRRAY